MQIYKTAIPLLAVLSALSIFYTQRNKDPFLLYPKEPTNAEAESICNAKPGLPQEIAACIIATTYGVEEANIVWEELEIEIFETIDDIQETASKELSIELIEIDGAEIKIRWVLFASGGGFAQSGGIGIFTLQSPIRVIFLGALDLY
ncbi:MAG: hypothetical protein O2971_13190 [Proteobacteria bacterium]|nr:hypothetical protein [Pseudomonadota bacterium]